MILFWYFKCSILSHFMYSFVKVLKNNWGNLQVITLGLSYSVLLKISLFVWSQEDWGQMTTQADEVAITEEDLELIKERETNIRQLEVSLCLIFLILIHKRTSYRKHSHPHSLSPGTTHRWFEVFCLFQSDIMDVNQIFKDLAVMIHDQGDMIGEWH